MKQKLYLETTIPSYLVSRPSRDIVVAGHQQLTREWWEKRRKDFDIFVSQFVLDEARMGDKDVAQKRLDIVETLDLLQINSDVTELAAAIVEAGAIPEKHAVDAAHIAIAAVHGMRYLLTWNCAHIANAEISSAVSSVCLRKGYQCPIICTPEELMEA